MADLSPATDDDDDLAAFSRPGPELAPIVDRVLRMPEHKHLVDDSARIHFLMANVPKVKQGRRRLGTCYMPRVNGELSSMFDWLLERYLGERPDFLVVLDATWWNEEATPQQREVLVFHELSHAVRAEDENGEPKFNREGEPVWAIGGHDIEEFRQVVARYGTWSDDVAAFVEAVREGDAAANLRRIR